MRIKLMAFCMLVSLILPLTGCIRRGGLPVWIAAPNQNWQTQQQLMNDDGWSTWTDSWGGANLIYGELTPDDWWNLDPSMIITLSFASIGYFLSEDEAISFEQFWREEFIWLAGIYPDLAFFWIVLRNETILSVFYTATATVGDLEWIF